MPPAHRGVVTRKANPVIAGGVVSGTWVHRPSEAEVTLFKGQDSLPSAVFETQVDKLATMTGRPVKLTVKASS